MLILKFITLLIYHYLLFELYLFPKILSRSNYTANATGENFINPLELSLKHLKSVLHVRGISYHDALEKKELSALVSLSDVVTNDEVDVAEKLNTHNSHVTETFSAKNLSHFSTGVLLVQMVSSNREIWDDNEWLKLVQQYHTAEMRTAFIHCKQKVCPLGFSPPVLVLKYSSAKNSQFKYEKLRLSKKMNFKFASKWVSETLKDATEEITSLEQLKRLWLSHSSRKVHLTQLIYVSELDRVPVFFSTLQSKFRRRFRFGRLLLKTNQQASGLSKLLNIEKSLPKSFVCLVTNQEIFIYNSNRGTKNYLHFQSLDLYLSTFDFIVSDVFVWTFYVCNVLALLTFATTSGNLFFRFASIVKSLFSYNFVFFTVFALRNYSPSEFTQICNLCLHRFATTRYAEHLFQYSQLTFLTDFFLTVVFVLYSWILFSALNRYGIIEVDKNHFTLSDLFLLNEDRILGIRDISEEREEEIPISGLSFQPQQVSTDYVWKLPVWRYKAPGGETLSRLGTSTSRRAQTVSFSRKFVSGGGSRGGNHSLLSHINPLLVLMRILLWLVHFGLRNLVFFVKCSSNPPSGIDRNNICSICNERYESGSQVCHLPCRDVFHYSCLLLSLAPNHHSCPTCRRKCL